MNTTQLRAWAAAVGWNPEQKGPVDEASDGILRAFVNVNRGRYEKRVFNTPAGLRTFAQLVEAYVEDFGFLSWLAVADRSDTYYTRAIRLT